MITEQLSQDIFAVYFTLNEVTQTLKEFRDLPQYSIPFASIINQLRKSLHEKICKDHYTRRILFPYRNGLRLIRELEKQELHKHTMELKKQLEGRLFHNYKNNIRDAMDLIFNPDERRPSLKIFPEVN